MNSYVRIRIYGKNIKLFIKRIYSMGIYYDNYKKISDNCIEIRLKYHDYIELRNIKTIYDIEKINETGLVGIKKYVLNNITLVISFLVSIIIILVLNNIVFNIDIIHNDKKIRTLVDQEIKKYGIKKYGFIPSYEKIQSIKEKIIKNNKDNIEWIEISKEGNNIIIKVVQRKSKTKKKKYVARNIVAKKAGIITKIEASNGQILKSKNDYVNKGDIIISGSIFKDDKVMKNISANGKVYAEVWYKVNIEYPLYYKEVIYLDEVKTNYVLTFLSKEYALKKNYEKSYLEKSTTLVKSNIIPFNIYKQRQRKIKVNKEKLTIAKAKEKAVSVANSKINSRLNSDEYIISKKALNFYQKDSKIIVDVFFKVYENITDYEIITERN